MNLIFPILAIVILTAPGPEEGSIKWSRGFPIPVPLTGAALIHGSARPDKGQTLIRAKVEYWQGGGVVSSKNVAIDAKGILGPTNISGLECGATYYVLMKVVQIRNGQEVTLVTAPAEINVR